jgi:hypothetical protein
MKLDTGATRQTHSPRGRRYIASDETLIRAKQLKLHAFRRMGQLANELQPAKARKLNGRGAVPGPVRLLVEKGLRKSEAGAARRLAKLTEESFEKLLAQPKGPTTIAMHSYSMSPVWRGFTLTAGSLRSYAKRTPAAQLAITAKSNPKHEKLARSLVTDLTAWLTTLSEELTK